MKREDVDKNLAVELGHEHIMVDGKISAMGTPEELKCNLGQPDMDHVFTYLARQAKRIEK